MNIKEEYIKETKEYLKFLRMRINKKEMLEDEIKILKKRQNLNDGIDFSDLGIKSQKSCRDISDLIETTDTKITYKEAQIDKINHDIHMYGIYSRELSEDEKEIIRLRYLDKSKKQSFEKISNKVAYSTSRIHEIHQQAIEKLAFYIYV